MKNIKIRIQRNLTQLIELNENHVEFINSIHGKDAFLKRVAADFLRKKKNYETKTSTKNSLK